MTKTVEIRLSPDQLEGTTATLTSWLVDIDNWVTEHQPIAELETDKVTMEVTAPASGKLSAIYVHPENNVEPETIMGTITTDTISITETKPIAGETTHQPIADKQPDNPREIRTHNKLSPAVRRLLAEHNLNLANIVGTGQKGRITKHDVLSYINEYNPDTSTTSDAPTEVEKQIDNRFKSKLIPYSPIRKKIASHMTESLLHTAPHVSSIWEMDMTKVIKHRNKYKHEYQDEGINLTFTSYFLSASCKALKAVPEINAHHHEQSLEVFDDINIGIGTALQDKGLIVPVIHQVQNLSFFAIAKSIDEKINRARNNKLQIEDTKHGTFTISNHGVSGSLLATPIIINQPQVAILGIGKLDKRVMVTDEDNEERIVIKPMCYVSLTMDHRVIDAYQTNRWLGIFVDTIEKWPD